MKSKERVLAAFKQEELDYVPCSIYFNQNLSVPGYDMNNWEDRTKLQLDLGADPVLDVGISNSMHPDVSTHTWVEDISGEENPILFKEYKTPAGTLRHAVRYTPEWVHGKDIPWSDFSASHCYEPLIKSADDVDAFGCIHQPPSEIELAHAIEKSASIIEFAKKNSLALRGLAGHGLATLMFVMGAENLIFFAMDNPEAFKKLAEIDSRVNVGRIKMLVQLGVDLLKRFGGYEQTNLFFPKIFTNVIVPLLKHEVKYAHNSDLPIYYRVVTGMKPLLGAITEIGFDCVEGFEPVLSDCSNEDIKNAFSGKACVWTGVSSPGHLGDRDDKPARKAVHDAVDTFGKRGFILGVTNSIRGHWPWKNTLALINEWKKLR